MSNANNSIFNFLEKLFGQNPVPNDLNYNQGNIDILNSNVKSKNINYIFENSKAELRLAQSAGI